MQWCRRKLPTIWVTETKAVDAFVADRPTCEPMLEKLQDWLADALRYDAAPRHLTRQPKERNGLTLSASSVFARGLVPPLWFRGTGCVPPVLRGSLVSPECPSCEHVFAVACDANPDVP